MTNIEIAGCNGQFTHLDSTPPEGTKPPVSVMTTEVVVENKPQELRSIKPYSKSAFEVPASLQAEGRIVLHALFACFERQQHVKEGLIGDLMWGFSQCGLAPELTYRGLQVLEKAGFIKFQAPDNSYVGLESTAADSAFVRYQPKLLNMVYDG